MDSEWVAEAAHSIVQAQCTRRAVKEVALPAQVNPSVVKGGKVVKKDEWNQRERKSA